MELYHEEEAAIGGHVNARFNLGRIKREMARLREQ